MNQIEIQSTSKSNCQPDQEHIQLWVDAALEDFSDDVEIVVRIVDEQESADLNERYRHKQGPTNILSFPIEIPEGIDLNLLGDLVICAPVLEKEALDTTKGITGPLGAYRCAWRSAFVGLRSYRRRRSRGHGKQRNTNFKQVKYKKSLYIRLITNE